MNVFLHTEMVQVVEILANDRHDRGLEQRTKVLQKGNDHRKCLTHIMTLPVSSNAGRVVSDLASLSTPMLVKSLGHKRSIVNSPVQLKV